MYNIIIFIYTVTHEGIRLNSVGSFPSGPYLFCSCLSGLCSRACVFASAFGVPAPKLPGLLGCRLIDPSIQFWDLYFVSGSAAPQSDLHFLYLQFTFTNFSWVCGTLVRYLCTLTIWYLQFCAGCFLVSVSALTVPPTGW